MNFLPSFTVMAQGTDLTTTNLFPFPFTFHLIFSIAALIFFGFMFFKQHKPYQAIFAVAIPASLAVWISESRTLFSVVGVAELILILAALVSAIIFSRKAKKSAEQENVSADADTESGEAKE